MDFGYTFQGARGTASSFQINPATGANIAELRPFNDSQVLFSSPVVGGGLEIMSPSLPIPLGPRLFVDGEIFAVRNQRRPVAREGSPGQLAAPSAPTFSAVAVLGQGSETEIDLDNVSYGAGIGLAFPVRLGSFRLLVKPSARYLRRGYTATGLISNAARTDLGAGPIGNPTIEVQIAGRSSLDVDAIGPGLEFDLEAIRVRDFGISVFLNGAAFRILGDRSLEFGGTVLDSEGANTFRGTFSADIDTWIFRAGVGLRIKWLGLPSGWLGTGG